MSGNARDEEEYHTIAEQKNKTVVSIFKKPLRAILSKDLEEQASRRSEVYD